MSLMLLHFNQNKMSSNKFDLFYWNTRWLDLRRCTAHSDLNDTIVSINIFSRISSKFIQLPASLSISRSRIIFGHYSVIQVNVQRYDFVYHLNGTWSEWKELHEFESYRHINRVGIDVHIQVVAVGSSGILKAKQKLGVTFNFDKQDVIDFTKFSIVTMCRASEANSWK